jgi:hypothetical protein
VKIMLANTQLCPFHPADHLINVNGKAYLPIQARLRWFLQDQRQLVAAGVARMPYRIQTELVELDRRAGTAQFKTTIRDVLGNEVTMYGMESAKDFPDYPEHASGKSLGRALAMLGYSTVTALAMTVAA